MSPRVEDDDVTASYYATDNTRALDESEHVGDVWTRVVDIEGAILLDLRRLIVQKEAERTQRFSRIWRLRRPYLVYIPTPNFVFGVKTGPISVSSPPLKGA